MQRISLSAHYTYPFGLWNHLSLERNKIRGKNISSNILSGVVVLYHASTDSKCGMCMYIVMLLDASAQIAPVLTPLQIICWRKYLKFPEERLSPEAKDLMRRLLCDADHRLGTRGAAEVKVNIGHWISRYSFIWPDKFS